ncbi:endonuclease III [Croceicoccus sp. YJ47]|uniref:endonuclease III n=1 Tax=Croceicoccus sp. YJ47 TaxID=2798724 RepID=UPI00192336EF|nr:endonuclease III [Croceicoccus sp. YJ47]QQN72949.1 endonuclease III [Croceicoccus sp. YJ47]
MTRDQIFEFFRRLAEDNPDPETELEYGNAFQLVVAVALSAQATDVGVNKATRALFAKVETPQQMLDLGEDGLKEHIKTIGLYNSKAKNVIALSRLLVEDYGGTVPDTREDLVRLPGVGRKTANVVLNCWFGQETFAVDTHIFRVGNRTGLAKGKTPEAVEAKLEKRVPGPFRMGAHHWLILHGRYVCKARTPECWRCTVADLCSFRGKVMEKPAKR